MSYINGKGCTSVIKRKSRPWVGRQLDKALYMPATGKYAHPLTPIQFPRVTDLESWLYLYAFNHQEVLS